MRKQNHETGKSLLRLCAALCVCLLCAGLLCPAPGHAAEPASTPVMIRRPARSPSPVPEATKAPPVLVPVYYVTENGSVVARAEAVLRESGEVKADPVVIPEEYEPAGETVCYVQLKDGAAEPAIVEFKVQRKTISAQVPATAVQTPDAEEPAAYVITVQAKGLTGSFPVTVTIDHDGTVKTVTLGESGSKYDEPFLALVNTEEFLGQFVGQTAPVTADVTAGATVTGTAVVEAVNQAAQMVRGTAKMTSVKVSELGFGGPVAVTLTLDEDGKIAGLQIGDDEFAETQGIGGSALEPETARAFIGLTPPLAVADVDIMVGATVTKTAIVNAINKGAEKLKAAGASAPAESTAGPAANSITIQANGLTGTFPVTVTLNSDGTVKSVTLGEGSSETVNVFLAGVNTEEFLGQFVGKSAPLEGIDTVSGATVSSRAIADAVNEALTQAQQAEE